MIVSFKLNFYFFTHYSVISLTIPAPTVRPPSRIANLSPLSIATGVINSIQTFGSATIVPSHDGHGTNGLAMSPLTLLSPQFGHSSKHAHIILARKMNLHLQLMPLSGYGFDIDTPADLRWMAGLTSASRTKSYLDQIGLLEAKGLSWKLVDSRLGLSG